MCDIQHYNRSTAVRLNSSKTKKENFLSNLPRYSIQKTKVTAEVVPKNIQKTSTMEMSPPGWKQLQFEGK